MPLKDVEFVCRHKAPDYLYTHLTGIAGNFNFERFLAHVSQRFTAPLVISGELARTHMRQTPAGEMIQFCRSVSEVLEFVSTV
jgi:hypothetical protein